jgi:hypothetical protein
MPTLLSLDMDGVVRSLLMSAIGALEPTSGSSAPVSTTATSTLPVSIPAPVTPPATATPTAQVSSGGSNGQIWSKVASESASIQLALPIGTPDRFGTGMSWQSPIPVSQGTLLTPSYTSLGGSAADPAPGAVKELDLPESSTFRSIFVIQSAGSMSLATVAAAPTQ